MKAYGRTISIDGKGRWVGNVFIDGLRRSVPYEDVDLETYDSPAALRAGLTYSFQFSITVGSHQTVNRQEPDTVYEEKPEKKKAAS